MKHTGQQLSLFSFPLRSLVVIGINRKLLSNRQPTRHLTVTLKPRLFERLVRLAMMASSCKSKSIKFWSRKKSATEIWRKHSTIPVRNDRGQRSEVRGQRSEVRDQRSDVRCQNGKVSRMPEANFGATFLGWLS